jgi:hypothetical protein
MSHADVGMMLLAVLEDARELDFATNTPAGWYLTDAGQMVLRNAERRLYSLSARPDADPEKTAVAHTPGLARGVRIPARDVIRKDGPEMGSGSAEMRAD